MWWFFTLCQSSYQTYSNWWVKKYQSLFFCLKYVLLQPANYIITHSFFMKKDTDSFVFSTSRDMDQIDKEELNLISSDDSPTLFCNTRLATNMAKTYFRCFHNILDFSCLTKVQHCNLFQCVQIKCVLHYFFKK